MCRLSKNVIVIFLMVAGILACNHMVMAQPLISTTYPDSLVTNLPFVYRNFNKIQALNNPANEYIVVSNAETLGASYVIAKLDSSGNMIKQRLLYRGSYSTYITGTFIFYENKLFVPTWHDEYSSLLVFDIFLNLIDSINISKPIGTTDSSNQYIKRTGASEIIYDIDTIGGYIYLTGGLYSTKDSINEVGSRWQYHQNIRAVVYKYNSNLDLIWRKEVGDTNNFKYNLGQKLLSLKDGQLCVVAQNQRFILNHRIEFQPFTSRVTLYKLDTSGNVLHQNTLPKEPGRWYFRQVANACAVTPQNEVVLGGYYCDSSLAEYDGQGKVLLFKVDSAFNLKWEYTGATAYKTNAVNKVLIDSSGNIMASGQHEQLVYRNRPWNDSVIVSGFMAWFTPNGELTKWSNVYYKKAVSLERKYNGTSDPNMVINYISDLIPISNNQFAGCGLIASKMFNVSSPWFFITDSNGCVNATCDTSLFERPNIKLSITSPDSGDSIVLGTPFVLSGIIKNTGSKVIEPSNQISLSFSFNYSTPVVINVDLIIEGKIAENILVPIPLNGLNPGDSIIFEIPSTYFAYYSYPNKIGHHRFCVTSVILSNKISVTEQNANDNASCAELFFDIFSSTNEINLASYQLNISPNPTTTQVHIKSPIQIERYTLTNTNGISVQSGVLDASNSIDVSQLPPGLYFLQLQLENGQTVTKKLVRSSK